MLPSITVGTNNHKHGFCRFHQLPSLQQLPCCRHLPSHWVKCLLPLVEESNSAIFPLDLLNKATFVNPSTPMAEMAKRDCNAGVAIQYLPKSTSFAKICYRTIHYSIPHPQPSLPKKKSKKIVSMISLNKFSLNLFSLVYRNSSTNLCSQISMPYSC